MWKRGGSTRWLPPQAPGAAPPPRFVPPPDEEPPAPAPRAPEPPPAADEPGHEVHGGWAPPRPPDLPAGGGRSDATPRTPEGWGAPSRRADEAPQGWGPPPARDRPRPHGVPGWAPRQEDTTVNPPPPEPAAVRRLAVAAIAFAALALALLVLSVGLSFLLSLVLAGSGWLCAAQARRRLRDAGLPDDRGTSQFGLWLAMAAAGLAVAAMVVWIILILFGFTPEDLRDDLQRQLDRRELQRAVWTLGSLLRGP